MGLLFTFDVNFNITRLPLKTIQSRSIIFIEKSLSGSPLKRHNASMQLKLIRNIWEPTELVRFLVTANIVLFITALFFAPGAVNYSLNPMVFLSPATGVLFKLGASGTLPVFVEDRWWTLITANYLHGSLLHLLFNISALHSVGKINIEIYAPSRLFLIYFLGGLLSMAVSSLAGIPLTLGASGAVCALIGSMSYDQWRASEGDLKRRIASVGIWVALLAMTGLVLPNVNNWAHAVGFVSGFLLGSLFWPETPKSETRTFRVAATSCMLLTIAALIYGLLFS
jgi:rhomboid protease GluP